MEPDPILALVAAYERRAGLRLEEPGGLARLFASPQEATIIDLLRLIVRLEQRVRDLEQAP